MHLPSDVCVDSFQADRGPDMHYRTSSLGALSTQRKGGFYHDGRFADLNAVAAREMHGPGITGYRLVRGVEREHGDTEGRAYGSRGWGRYSEVGGEL